LEDIKNEVRAVQTLCKSGHKNIVAVLEHGELDSSYYYIDMELCDNNLQTYIAGGGSPDIETQSSKFNSRFPSQGRARQLWEIMEDVTNGVAFIHSNKEIHRDLKPRNSIMLLGLDG
jgi:serine/threonine protein kinase